MSLMNKVKNFFYEDIEEEDEEEILRKEALKREKKEKKREEKLIKFEEKEKEREKEVIIKDKPSNPELSERELFKSEKTFNFPMDLGDNIFDEKELEEEKKQKEKEESRKRIKEERNIYARTVNRGNYTSVDTSKEEENKKFHPSPVVSPVYGILDKNYTVDDVVDKNLSKTKEFSIEKKIVDFDTVRNKAYKELDDEIEKTLNGTKDIFYNLDEDLKEKNDNTIEDYIEESYDKNENEDDDVIITYEGTNDYQKPVDDVGNDDSEIDEVSFETPDVEIPKVEEKKTRRGRKPKVVEEPEEELDTKEDLFNLIDNMYNDEEDE